MIAFLDGFGGSEMILILAIVLILFGGEKMPELARGLGKVMREIKKATGDVEREFKKAMDEVPASPAADLQRTLAQATATLPRVTGIPRPAGSPAPLDERGDTPAVAAPGPAVLPPTPPASSGTPPSLPSAVSPAGISPVNHSTPVVSAPAPAVNPVASNHPPRPEDDSSVEA